MRSSRDRDILEALLEARVMILEISSRFAPGLARSSARERRSITGTWDAASIAHAVCGISY
jgi:hypothetical protein